MFGIEGICICVLLCISRLFGKGAAVGVDSEGTENSWNIASSTCESGWMNLDLVGKICGAAEYRRRKRDISYHRFIELEQSLFVVDFEKDRATNTHLRQSSR